jgi:hypothetical protein
MRGESEIKRVGDRNDASPSLRCDRNAAVLCGLLAGTYLCEVDGMLEAIEEILEIALAATLPLAKLEELILQTSRVHNLLLEAARRDQEVRGSAICSMKDGGQESVLSWMLGKNGRDLMISVSDAIWPPDSPNVEMHGLSVVSRHILERWYSNAVLSLLNSAISHKDGFTGLPSATSSVLSSEDDPLSSNMAQAG